MNATTSAPHTAIDGSTVVVGASKDVGAGLGSAYVFRTRRRRRHVRPGGQADGRRRARDKFGDSVAIDGDTVVVEADDDDGLQLGLGLRLPHERRRRHVRRWPS